MKFKLADFPKRQYSLLERQVFGYMLQSGEKVTHKDLILLRRKAGKWTVKHPHNIICTVMSRLKDKVKSNKEPFVIKSERDMSKRGGEASYWIEPKPPTSPSTHVGSIKSALFD